MRVLSAAWSSYALFLLFPNFCLSQINPVEMAAYGTPVVKALPMPMVAPLFLESDAYTSTL